MHSDDTQTEINKATLSYTDEENDIENRTSQSYKAFDTGTAPGGVPVTAEIFAELKGKVFTSRPNIANLYRNISPVHVADYARSHIRENRNKIVKKRKPELAGTLKAHISKVLGTGIAESVVRQLKTNDSVSTVQHSSPFSHPDSTNSILAHALPYFGAPQPGRENALVFACGGISFNNTKFPRGHLFHTFAGEKVHTSQLSFFGHTVDARPVLHHAPYTHEAIKDMRNTLLQLMREEKLSKEIYEDIMIILQDIYNQPHPLSCDDFIDQLTVTNYWFFKKIFSSYNRFVPSLVYLAQEKVCLDLLLAHHLTKETTIHTLLFDKNIQPLIESYFDGITGAFVRGKQLGTYLFWGLPKNSKYRVQLWREGNKLTTKDGTFSVELTPQSIEQAIRQKELIPSVMLTFWVLALYYGLILGGGYEQTFYLTQTKKKYIELLRQIGDSESIAACEDLITTNLVIPRPQLTYLKGPQDLRIPATGLDMLLYGAGGKSWGRLLDAAKRTTMGEVIERTLPSIYREYCKDSGNSEVLSRITERDIEFFTSLDKKIPAISSL